MVIERKKGRKNWEGVKKEVLEKNMIIGDGGALIIIKVEKKKKYI